jgi:hypothetical protein
MTDYSTIIVEGYSIAAKLREYANGRRGTDPELAEKLDTCVEDLRRAARELEEVSVSDRRDSRG